ncbi:MAG: PspC domain-containing protein [Acidimicrobiia bacterium]|nr:PspC domain-containing protein [Acidimicrobiia bacterium]
MTNSPSSFQSNNTDRLYRPKEGRVIAGVAAALANKSGIDVGLVRLGFAVSLFFGGLGFFAYLAAWAVIPSEGETQSAVENWFS